jgi:hypothetical protein
VLERRHTNPTSNFLIVINQPLIRLDACDTFGRVCPQMLCNLRVAVQQFLYSA